MTGNGSSPQHAVLSDKRQQMKEEEKKKIERARATRERRCGEKAPQTDNG